MTRNSTIELSIDLDGNNVPEKIHWTSEDSNPQNQESKAFMLSIWDKNEQNTLRIDLWTPEMTVDEMKQFFHQTLLTMADTFEKATGEHLICEDLKDYCFHFAQKMNLLPSE